MSRARYVGMRLESEYGTAEEDDPVHYEDTICGIQPDLGWLIPAPVAKRAYQKRQRGFYRAQGPIGDFDVTPEGIIGELLNGLFGSSSPNNDETGVYTHTFTPQDTLPSYTIRAGVEQTERVLPGCLIEALTLKYSAGQFLKANALVYSGFPETKDTIGTPTIDPLQPLTQIDDLVNITIGGDAYRATIISDIEITIKNNIPFSRGDLSGRTFSTKRIGHRTVTGRLTAYFEDTTEYDDFIAGTPFDLIAGVTGPLIGDSETYRYNVTLNLYELQFLRDAAPNIVTQDQPLVINAPFQAFYDTGELLEAKAFLRNSVADY